MGVRHLVEVFCNFHFHVVGDALVFLDAVVQRGEFLFILLGQQFSHHAKHPLHSLGKRFYFLMCFEHRQFRGLHDARSDEMQAEVFLFFHSLGFDDPAYESLDVGHKPDEQQGVGDVECRVERCKHHGYLCQIGVISWVASLQCAVKTYEVAYKIDERVYQYECPCHTYNVDCQVREGCPSSLCVGAQSHDVRGDGGADVLT